MPPPMSVRRLRDWRAVRAEVTKCDVLFWMQYAHRPEPAVHLAAALKPSARRAAFAFDAWKMQIDKIGYSAVLHGLDPCFVAYREAVEELRERFPRGRFEWLPFGIDTHSFRPRAEGKSIFAFWMGRRDEPLHQALLRYCEKRGLAYVYSDRGSYSADELGRIASSAEYFLVTPPHPERSGGYSPLVMRYMEGLAAGTRLLGVLPKSGEYERLLPLNAICQVAPDGSDLDARLEADERDPDRRRAVEAACAYVREHHSWKRRAEQIHQRLAFDTAFEFPTIERQGFNGELRREAPMGAA
ncbi:glycosyltransferase family protein [Roseiarcus fermentans]|nr:glycosyltransferase [Roseiarcus fermentans]